MLGGWFAGESVWRLDGRLILVTEQVMMNSPRFRCRAREVEIGNIMY